MIFRDVILCLGMFWLTTQISQHLEDVDLRGRGGEEVGAGRGGGTHAAHVQVYDIMMYE